MRSGWGWERIEDILLLGIPVVLTAFVMYLPFYIGFDSQAGGITAELHVPNAWRAFLGDVGHAVHSSLCVSDLSMAKWQGQSIGVQGFLQRSAF